MKAHLDKAATWQLLGPHVQRIADGHVPPREGLNLVIDAYLGAGLYDRQRECAGDAAGIEKLYACWAGYFDLGERPDEVSYDGCYGSDAVAALDRDAVRFAREWMALHHA